MNSSKVNTLQKHSANYPTKLSKIGFNSSIYWQGNLDFLTKATIGIIGTRKPTPYGISITKTLIDDLKHYDISIISGLALGVDSLAHKAALQNNLHTTAVVPGDLEHIYPRRHEQLGQGILQNSGALITLQRSLASPMNHHFHERNLLLAAVSDVLIVIEAAKKSGTMITVAHALDFGKPVMAVPGRLYEPMSQGTNHLIAAGARPVITAVDIVNELGIEQQDASVQYSLQEASIIKAIDDGARTLDEVQAVCKLPMSELNKEITDMEIKGMLHMYNGEVFKRKLA